jgi:tRNA uracil 4-sulfurtransferase
MIIGIHYSEIALKGGNRNYFEKRLKDNIKKTLKGEKYESIERLRDRFIIALVKDSNAKNILEKLKKVFGINHIYMASRVKKDISSILEKSEEIFDQVPKKTSFKVNASRADKDFPLNSMEINKKIGEALFEKGFPVDVKKPKVMLFIDILKDYVLIYTKKIKCNGGLPVGSSGKAVVLFSGGIDSPVASWEIMKRGCAPVYVHFHALRPEDAEKSKIPELVKILNEYSNYSKLYLIPYDIFQVHSPKENDMIVFRRFINRVAEKIAEDEGAIVLVTGESIGQVGSQTLQNISVINDAVEMPIIQPLITENKEDIINKAKKIGTYDLSIKEYKDCCSIISREAKTKTKLDYVKKSEKEMDLDNIIEETLKSAKIIEFRK